MSLAGMPNSTTVRHGHAFGMLEDGPDIVFGKHMGIRHAYSSTYARRTTSLIRENKTPRAVDVAPRAETA
jgi:hypothetical protein